MRGATATAARSVGQSVIMKFDVSTIEAQTV